MSDPRISTRTRETSETRIHAELCLDGQGDAQVQTGLGFLDHMLGALCRHAAFDLRLDCEGDIWVDDHHSVEDCALVLGEALDQALGARRGIVRFADATVVMDEALCRVAVDLGGRAFADVNLGLRREMLGQVATENLRHFFVSLAQASRSGFHVDVLKGCNDHHKIEAAFKALALCLRRAVTRRAGDPVPSTKGSL